jgi:hypothetical protein
MASATSTGTAGIRWPPAGFGGGEFGFQIGDALAGEAAGVPGAGEAFLEAAVVLGA